MKLDIIIVDFALVALVFIPYFLFILLSGREKRKLEKKFLEEALKAQLEIEEKDAWNNTMIGLDIGKSKILFVQKRKTEIAIELIDLKKVRSCEIVQEVQTVKISKRDHNILKQINLQLMLNNNSSRNIIFYNCEETCSEDYEWKHAERWSRKINALTGLRSSLNSAA